MSETCCDLGTMTNEELEQLQTEVQRELGCRHSEEENEFFKTAEFKALKKEFKALKKEFKGLTKKRTFEMMVPLKFTVGMSLSESNFDYYLDQSYKVCVDDLFNADVDIKVLPGDYSKEVQQMLQGAVNETSESICLDVLKLDPNGEVVDQFVDKFNNYMSRLDETPARTEDFE